MQLKILIRFDNYIHALSVGCYIQIQQKKWPRYIAQKIVSGVFFPIQNRPCHHNYVCALELGPKNRIVL